MILKIMNNKQKGKTIYMEKNLEKAEHYNQKKDDELTAIPNSIHDKTTREYCYRYIEGLWNSTGGGRH